MSPDPARPRPVPAPARTVIVGDVHGCVDELEDLLRACGLDETGDQVILVGDLVAKGPDSQGVVQMARERGFAAVLGNHDAKVLTFRPTAGGGDRPAAKRGQAAGASGPGHHQEVARTLNRADWNYLAGLPLYLSVPRLNTVVVHAGLLPGLPIDQQPRDLLINLRSIAADGTPSKRVDGGAPWASVWPGPARAVFGHDAVRGLQQHRFATGLDTGCVYGRALTALILPEGRLVSVPARRAYNTV